MSAGSYGGPWLGVVADDVTGAVDLAGEVAAAGRRTVVLLGRPDADAPLPACDCAVVALTTRTAPVDRAVEDSVASARWLLGRGASRLYQKYCSTFDSTDTGNIGPVGDALADLVGGAAGGVSVGTPATPTVGRTQYLGHLFVAGRLLSESSLRDHPLTPMRDADLVRVLGRQTPRAVGLVPAPAVRAGAEAVRDAIARRLSEGCRHVLVDAADDADLDVLADAVTPSHGARALLAGAAGLAAALARLRDAVEAPVDAGGLPRVEHGPSLVVSGSCSERTREQVARHRGPSLRISAPELAADRDGTVARADAFVADTWTHDPAATPLVHSTGGPEQVRAEQESVGRERAATLVQGALAEVARRAVVERGARRLLVAGGETSGAVTAALGVRALHVGPRVEPGLPWTLTPTGIALLLKSGNFGSPELFSTAWEVAP